jgi:hypothetical protein
MVKPKTKYYPTKKINGIQLRLHRIVMQQYLHRRLSRDELVHHKNENPLDNDISNLVIVSRATHNKLHKRNKKKSNIERFITKNNVRNK